MRGVSEQGLRITRCDSCNDDGSSTLTAAAACQCTHWVALRHCIESGSDPDFAVPWPSCQPVDRRGGSRTRAAVVEEAADLMHAYSVHARVMFYSGISNIKLISSDAKCIRPQMPHRARGDPCVLSFFECMPLELAHKVVPPERTTMLLRASRLLCAHVQRLRAPASIQAQPGRCARHVCAALDRALTAPAYTITSLDISQLRASIDREDWAGVLSRCVALQRLDLCEGLLAGDAPDKLATGLQALTSLRHLGMVGTDLDLTRAKSLACVLTSGMQCKRLELRFNRITPTGAENFAAGLGTCGALTELVLDHNKVHRQGIRHLAAGIAHCTALTKLSLRMIAMRDDGATALSAALCALTALEHLNLACNFLAQEGTTRLAAGLVHCSKLKHLDLSSNECGHTGVAVLQSVFQQCSGLHTLRLASAEMGNFGAERMDRSLPAPCALRQLDLCNNLIDGDGCKKIASVIARCGELTELRLSFNNFGDDGGESLARGLKGCSALARLDLNSCNLTSMGMQHIARALAGCAWLRILNLNNNQIAASGATELARALGQCTGLVKLNACANKLGLAGATSLAHALRGCTGLCVLDVSANHIGDGGATALARALPRQALVHLDLSSNGIEHTGACALAHFFGDCTSLRCLRLSHNDIGPDAAAGVAAALAHCSKLARLYLKNCGAGDAAFDRRCF